MNTTVRLKAGDVTKDWHVIDAAGRPLGRVATEAATLLRGKHKPNFEPHLDMGDFVIIINAAKVTLTGRKAEQKVYYRHSGYPGGLSARPYLEQLERFPERVLEQAVKGMLPKGTLGEAMAKHLKVYRGPDHPHASQVTGSQRAKEKREAALQAALGTPMKARRLRPLAVPEGTQLLPILADDDEPAAPAALAPEPVNETTPRTGDIVESAVMAHEPEAVEEAAEAKDED